MKFLRFATTLMVATIFTILASNAWSAPPAHAKGVPTEKFQWGPFEEFGFPMVECDGFDILIDWRGEGFWTTHYNKDGSIKFEFFLGKDTYLFWYNSETPA